MANLTPTNLLMGLSNVSEDFKRAEFRMPNTAALSTAYIGKQTENPMAEIRKREDRATWFDFGIRKADEGETERTALHTAASMDSLRRQLTWGSVVDGFSISEKQCDNNTQGYAGVFSSGLKNSIFNNLSKMDNAFMALIKADVSEINLGGLNGLGAWSAADNIFEIEADQSEYALAIMEANMNNNDYNDQFIALVDSVGFINASKALNQGSQNAVNMYWQLGNTKLVKTNKQIYSGYNGSMLMFPQNQVGITPWIPKQNRQPINEMAAMTPNGSFGSVQVPIYDQDGNVAYSIDVALSMYTTRANTSTRNGSKQDLLTQIEVSWDYAYMSAPLSSLRTTGDFVGKSDSVVYSFGVKPTIVL